jgi:hypothetical protein
LAWLPGSDQPTRQAGTAQPEPHGAPSPYSPAVGSAGHRLVRPRPEGGWTSATARRRATRLRGRR